MVGTVGFLFNRLFGGPWGLGQFSRPNIWESRPSKCALPYERSDVAWVGGWLIRKSFQPHLYGISLLSMVGRQSSDPACSTRIYSTGRLRGEEGSDAGGNLTSAAAGDRQPHPTCASLSPELNPRELVAAQDRTKAALPVRPSSCPLRARRWVDAHPLATTNRSHGSQLSPNVMSPKEARSGGDHRWGGARRWERERESVWASKWPAVPGGGGNTRRRGLLASRALSTLALSAVLLLG